MMSKFNEMYDQILAMLNENNYISTIQVDIDADSKTIPNLVKNYNLNVKNTNTADNPYSYELTGHNKELIRYLTGVHHKLPLEDTKKLYPGLFRVSKAPAPLPKSRHATRKFFKKYSDEEIWKQLNPDDK